MLVITRGYVVYDFWIFMNSTWVYDLGKKF